jgi:hypothetical protein
MKIYVKLQNNDQKIKGRKERWIGHTLNKPTGCIEKSPLDLGEGFHSGEGTARG